MAEFTPSLDKKLQLNLQLQASDGLKHLVKELIKPPIRSAFVERILYVTLRPEVPITVTIDETRTDLISPDEHQAILAYTKNIENISSKDHMYTRSLHLAPEVGYYEYPNRDHGINLRFKLALTALEASNLFASPFDSVTGNRAYVVANLPGAILDSYDDRSDALQDIRRQLGGVGNKSSQQNKAPDQYYVSRPVIKKYHIDTTTE